MKRATDEVIESTASQFVEAVKPAVERTAERVVEASGAVANAVGTGIDALAQRRQIMLGAVRDTVTASPLRAVGITLFAGLVIGLLMRRH